MHILALILGIFLIIRWGIALINLLSKPILQEGVPELLPFVSILVPARNEAHNLPVLIEQFAQLDYPAFEVIVLNDASEDTTEEILKQAQTRHTFLSYYNGERLPEGWLGKNWACKQLSTLAKGEFLLFLDADISYLNPRIIPSALAFFNKHKLCLLSLFPTQEMYTWGERLVVPIMHYLLLSLLPLWWILRLPFASMAAANGQFMLFEAKTYKKYDWHTLVRAIVVEDIAIMREVKVRGLRGMTLLGNNWIRCRMYRSFAEGIKGFSKNILAGFGNSILGLIIYLCLILPLWLIVMPLFSIKIFLLLLLLIFSLRISISLISREPVLPNILLHLFQMMVLLWIGLRSVLVRITGKNVWKGRKIA